MDKELERAQALLLRWNKAATHAGAVGSEFINNPERVFECLAARQTMRERMAHRKGELGISLSVSEDTIAALHNAIRKSQI